MEKMNAAVLGIGGMGATHAEAARKSPYIDKIYGYEPDIERRNKRCEEIGIIPASLEEILADESIKFLPLLTSSTL